MNGSVILVRQREKIDSILVSGVTLSVWRERFQQHLKAMDDQFDPGHRVDHLYRVYVNACLLAETESIDWRVVMPAVWLHDCVAVSKKSAQRHQASRQSADAAIAFLKTQSYDARYFDAIAHCIEAHSFSADIKTKTLEARLVQDADRLDSLGAIGIARVMMVGSQLGSVLYHQDDIKADHREIDDKQYIVDHFYKKLLNLHASFKTESGRIQALQRTQYMKDYLDRLVAEIAC